jgi:hypothetical protein
MVPETNRARSNRLRQIQVGHLVPIYGEKRNLIYVTGDNFSEPPARSLPPKRSPKKERSGVV